MAIFIAKVCVEGCSTKIVCHTEVHKYVLKDIEFNTSSTDSICAYYQKNISTWPLFSFKKVSHSKAITMKVNGEDYESEYLE